MAREVQSICANFRRRERWKQIFFDTIPMDLHSNPTLTDSLLLEMSFASRRHRERKMANKYYWNKWKQPSDDEWIQFLLPIYSVLVAYVSIATLLSVVEDWTFRRLTFLFFFFLSDHCLNDDGLNSSIWKNVESH